MQKTDLDSPALPLATPGRPGREVPDRTEAERSVGEDERRFRFLLQNMREGYAHCRMAFENGVPVDFVYLDVNERFGELTGLTGVEGRWVSEILPGLRESSPDLFAGYGRVALTGVSERLESFVEPLDRWFSISVYSPASEHFVAVFEDITESKRSEEALRRSERILDDVESTAGLGHYVLDLRSGSWTSSPVLDGIFGIGPDFVRDIGGWASLVHPDDRAGMSRYFAEDVVGRKQRFEREYRIVHPSDGGERWVFGQGRLELDGEGSVVRMLGAIRDVTEQKRAELEREALLEIMLGLVSTPDPRAFLRLVHEAVSRVIFAENFFVLAHDPRTGLFDLRYFVDEFDEASPPTDLGRSLSAYVFRTGEALLFDPARFAELEARGEVAQVGTPSPSWLGAPLKKGSRSTGVLAVQDYEKPGRYSERDRAFLSSVAAQVGVAIERQRAEEEVRLLNADLESRVAARTAELEAAVADVEGFAYSVSHDLRAPVRAMNGFAAMLAESARGKLDEEEERLLGTIRRSSIRMGNLVDDLLDFSRTIRKEMKWIPVDLTTIVRDALADLLPASEKDRVEVRVSELPPASGDPGLIRVVLQNLLSNAVKFSRRREHPVIEVGSRPGPDGPEYFVRDNGVGFDMKYAGKLFGVFQRLLGVDEFEGTGIGLALVKRIVERHGGRVWAESELDRGATLWFSLGSAPGAA